MIPDGNVSARPAPDSSVSASSSLLARLQASDRDAWQRLVDMYGPGVFWWCRQSGLQAEDAADVFQEVFRAVAGAIGDFRGEIIGGSMRSWLRAITRNKICDHIRRRQRQPQAEGGTSALEKLAQVTASSGVLEQPEASEAPDPLWARALEAIRVDFQHHTWQAFWQVVVDARPAAEVAAELGMSLEAVYQAKSRVLRRLREEMQGLEMTD